MTVLERSAPTRRGTALTWLVIALVLVMAGSIGAVLAGNGDWFEKDPLDPEGAGPTGTRALTAILRDNGVEVIVARDRQSALRALEAGTGTGTTLVLPDAPMLSDEAIDELVAAAGDVVAIEPRARTTRLLVPAAALGGSGTGDAVSPQCDLADAQRAGAVTAGALFTAGEADAACYPEGEGFGLLVRDRGPDSRVALLDGSTVLTNEHLAADGNAALALNLTGRHPIVVWYVPALSDSDLTDTSPTLGMLTPPWVTPAIVLLICAAVTAAFWRGRRFGPLVAEDLPVTVRAAETMEGRARLYARGGDRTHAVDSLRIGTLGRLARLLGLGPTSAAGDTADAAADRIGAPRDVVRDILLDAVPTSDTELVALSDRLRDLEAAVRAAVRTERNAP